MFPVYFQKLYKDARIPEWGNGDNTNAAVDLFAYIPGCFPGEAIFLNPGNTCIVETGVSWYVDTDALDEFLRVSDANEGFGESVRLYKMAMIIKSRSGRAFKESLECSNAGVIDEGYRGPIKLKFYNNSEQEIMIQHGDRIAQGVIHLLPMVEIREWPMNERLPETIRGTNGFGSTGK